MGQFFKKFFGNYCHPWMFSHLIVSSSSFYNWIFMCLSRALPISACFPLSHVDMSPNLQHCYCCGESWGWGGFLPLCVCVSKESFFIIKVYFPEILILTHLRQKMTFLFAVSVLPKYLQIFWVSLLGFFKDFDDPYIVLCLPSTYLCFRLYSCFSLLS